MDELGVSIINIGFPGFSEEEKNIVRRLSNETFTQARLAASARMKKEDIDACLNSHIREISLGTPFNQLNLKYVLKSTQEQIIKKTDSCIKYAKKHGFIVNFILEDASRTPFESIFQIYGTAIEAGADRLVIEDTVGVFRPLSTRFFISRVKNGLSELGKEDKLLSIRCHNDFGLATANTLAAIEEGITYPQVCVAGYGEKRLYRQRSVYSY